MKNRPLVSVVTPLFKTERYLETFLNRLPNQTIFEHAQFVLDMNAPSQSEKRILNDFLESYPSQVKVIFSEEVANFSASVNRAIHNSDAKTLAIWNVDDLRTDSSLENQYLALEAFKRPSFTIDSFEVVSQFGQESGRLVKHENLSREMLLTGMYLGPFFMFSKELLDEIGYFDEQFYSGGDFDLAIRLARAASPVYPQGVAGYYLDAGTGLSTGPNSLQAVERTVIELRYGIFHKIDDRFVYPATTYVIPAILKDGYYIKLNLLFKDYDHYIRNILKEIEDNNLGRLSHGIAIKTLLSIKKNIKRISRKLGLDWQKH